MQSGVADRDAHQGVRRGLVVDDMADIRKSIGAALQSLGFDAVLCEDVGAALRQINIGPRFDIVITDFDMPGRNGAELAFAVWQQDPALPVLMVTGFGEQVPRLQWNGPFALLRKPFRRAELMGQVKQLTGSHVEPG